MKPTETKADHLTQEQSLTLLAGLREGDPHCFEQLLRDHGARLHATAGRILGNETEAQDAVQDALISAWKNIVRFEGMSSLHTWLHRITVNACLARLRTSRSKYEISLSANALAFEGLPAAWSEPGHCLEKRVAARQAIQRALQLIPDHLRLVLVLRDVEELTSREVALRLGIADSSVRQRLHRARSAMAEILRPELGDTPELPSDA